jgi:hypothetical protein
MANSTRLDGSPRLSDNNPGSTNAPGSNGRRADGWNNPARFGWLDGTAAAKSDPQGGSWTPIGRGSRAFDATPPDTPYTTGMQSNRKPKR